MPMWCQRSILFTGYALITWGFTQAMQEAIPVLRDGGGLWDAVKSMPFSAFFTAFIGLGLRAFIKEVQRIISSPLSSAGASCEVIDDEQNKICKWC